LQTHESAVNLYSKILSTPCSKKVVHQAHIVNLVNS